MKIPQKIKDVIKNSKRIIIVISRPIDNDCLASGLVLYNQLRRIWKKDVDIISPENVKSYHNHLPLIEKIEFKDTKNVNFFKYDLVVALDGGNTRQFAQVEEDSDFDFSGFENVLNIDHHSGNTHFAKWEIWDVGYSSTCEILMDTILDLERLSKNEATLLYAGIIGDSGNFKYNFSGRTMKFASMLIEKGANYRYLLNEMFYNFEECHFNVLIWCIKNTKFDYQKRISKLVINEDDTKDQIGYDFETVKNGLYLYKKYFALAIRGIDINIIYSVRKNLVVVTIAGKDYENKIPLTQVRKFLKAQGGGHFNLVVFSMKGEFLDIYKKVESAIMDLRKKYEKTLQSKR